MRRTRSRPGLPGTPPLVEQARAVVREHNVRLGIGLVAGVLLSLGLGAVALHVRSDTMQLLIGVPAWLAWVPVMLAATVGGPDNHLVHDAQAVLLAWTARREAWAEAVLEDCEPEGAADVQAWTEAEVELLKMRSSA